jgi:hypothetical protein
MLNNMISPLGPKVDNTSGATGIEDCSEFNDQQSELLNAVQESGQILLQSKSPYQFGRSMTLHGMGAQSWIENSGSANLSNLTPYNGGTLIVFSTAFINGNIITLTINGSPLSPVTYAISSANTYALILSAIQAAYPSAAVTVNSTYNCITMYLAGTTYTVTLTVTGGVSQPSSSVSYGFTAPDSMAEMDGAIIVFEKAVGNTGVPQVNIGATTGALLGAVNVVMYGGGAVPAGYMSGYCEIRFNLTQNYWELLYSASQSTLSMNAPPGTLMNGYFQPTVAGNNLTVAVLAMNGSTPSGSNPVYCRIGNTVFAITSALSVTMAAGTNWFNSGTTNLATYSIDYFVYLGYNATAAGVVLAVSRIPYAMTYADFNTTNTNDHYAAISSITYAASTDQFVNIGRFAAVLGISPSYNWSVSAFTADTLVQRPIYNTRWLTYSPTFTWLGTTPPATPNLFCQYRISNADMYVYVLNDYAGAGSGITGCQVSMPMTNMIVSGGSVMSSAIIATYSSPYNNTFSSLSNIGNPPLTISCASVAGQFIAFSIDFPV